MSGRHRERIAAVLRGARTDRRACGEFFIADEFVRAWFSLPNAGPLAFDQRLAVVEQLDLDVATVSFSAGWGALAQPDDDEALAQLTRWTGEGSRYVLALIDGPFSYAAKARGLNMLAHYSRGAPHVAGDLYRRGADECCVVAQAVRDAGADGVILGEDIAYNASTFLSPDDLRAHYFVELRRAAADIQALGMSVFFHSDGNLNAVLDDLAGCGLDGLQGLEAEAGMQMAAVRARVGPALVLWGNLSFDFLSQPRTDAEIGQVGEVNDARVIFGSSAGLVQGMHPDTVRRAYRAVTATA
jgi:uroporphyrinogen decarboxylase